jgi:hypothetical protein
MGNKDIVCDYCELNKATHIVYIDIDHCVPLEHTNFHWSAAKSRKLCKRCLLLYKFKSCSEGVVKKWQVVKI